MGQPPYVQQPQVQQPPLVQQTTNRMAIASMVSRHPLDLAGSILSLVFGYVAIGKSTNSRAGRGGLGMAIAGVVLGWKGIGLFALFMPFFMVDR